MNIEEANDNLIMLKYFLQEEGDENWEKYCEAIEALLTAYEKEKEKNKELSSSYDKLAKECNEENRRCMLLTVENQDLKEKNKEHKQRITYLENKIFNQKQTIKEGGIKQCQMKKRKKLNTSKEELQIRKQLTQVYISKLKN